MKDYYLLNEKFKNTLGLQQYAPLSTNALNIDLSGKTNGKVEQIRTSDASTIDNLFIKSGTVIALKRQFILTNRRAIVELDMLAPYLNTKWQNDYRDGWQGWKLISGQIPLWSGKADQGDTITVAFPRAYFNSLDVYFANDEIMNIPLKDNEMGSCGSLVTTSGEEFYLKNVYLQFTTDTTIKVLSCKEKVMSSNVVSTKSIVKIVGRP